MHEQECFVLECFLTSNCWISNIEVFEMKFNSQEGQNNASQTVASLAKEIDYKNHQLLELEHKYNDTNALFRKVVIGHTEAINAKERTCLEMEQKFHESSMTSRELVSEKDMLLKRYGTEMSLMKSVNRKLENVVECQKKELERRAKELAESKTQNDKVHRDLKDEIAKLKDQLRDQISVSSSSCLNARINALEKEIEEKNEDILSFQTLNHILAARDFKSNEELQNCRRDLIDGLQDMLNKRTKLVIKRMGEVDQIPFREMCLERIPSEDWQGVAAKICSCWQDQVQDPLWHPFKIDSSDGITREIVNEDDTKLKSLRSELGESVYKAVATALLELNEYNPSGRYAVQEIWNPKEKRKASLREVIQYIIAQMKSHKKKRKRI